MDLDLKNFFDEGDVLYGLCNGFIDSYSNKIIIIVKKEFIVLKDLDMHNIYYMLTTNDLNHLEQNYLKEMFLNWKKGGGLK